MNKLLSSDATITLETQGTVQIRLDSVLQPPIDGNNRKILVGISSLMMLATSSTILPNNTHNIYPSNESAKTIITPYLSYGEYQEQNKPHIMPLTQKNPRKLFGGLKGKIVMQDGFDNPLPDDVISSFYGE
jgi:hypothetical protein